MSTNSKETTYNEDLLYGQKKHEYGTYSFLKVPPESNTSTITITAGGGSDLIFMLPTRTAYSLSKSILNFISTPVAASTGTFNWQWVHTVPFFQRVSVYTTGGRMIMDSDNMANRVCVELPLRTPINKLLNNDCPYVTTAGTNTNVGTAGGIWQGLNVINTATGNAATTASIVNFYGAHADAIPMFKAYTEKRELQQEGDATGGLLQPIVTWQVPLSVFGDILADPRILAFNEQIYVKFQMSPVAKCYFTSASNTNPTSTAGAGTSITLSGINLQLAVCQDRLVAMSIIEAVSTGGGLELLIDYTNSLKLAVSGTTQAFSNTITRAYGPRLKSVLWSVFNNTSGETSNVAYKRNNIAGATYTQAQTFFNSVPLQIQPLIIANGDDNQHLQKLLAGTAYQSSQEFYHDSFFMDYFYDIKKGFNVSTGNADPRELQGVELLSDVVYMLQLTTANVSNTIYVWEKFQRRLTINKSGTFMDGN